MRIARLGMLIAVVASLVSTATLAGNGKINMDNPRSARDFHNRGVIDMLKGDYDKALKDFNTALTLDSGFVESYVSRGTLHSLKNQTVMAKGDFDKALRLDPNNIDALFSRAGLFKLEGDYASALADYQHILQIDPNNEKTLQEMKLMNAVFRTQ